MIPYIILSSRAIPTFLEITFAFMASPSLEQADFFVADLLGNPVDCDQQDAIDNGIEQANGRSVGEIATGTHTDLINVSRDNLGGAQVQGALHQIDLLKSNGHYAAATHNEHDTDGRQDSRQIHVEDALPAACAVDHGSLMVFLRNGGQCRRVDDSIPAQILPNTRPDIDMAEGVGHAAEIVRITITAKDTEQGAVETVDRAKNHVDHGHKNHHGDEVGHIGDSLGELLEPLVGNGIDHKSEDDRDGETDNDLIKRDGQGISQNLLEVVAGEELLKPLQAHPLRSSDTVSGPILTEGNLCTIHRPEVENSNVDNWNQNQQMELPLLQHFSASTQSWSCLNDRFLHRRCPFSFI